MDRRRRHHWRGSDCRIAGERGRRAWGRTAKAKQSTTAPLVIAHRGASGYLPEHTLEGYALAIELGADYVEPDVVATKDGHLIARHEPMLGGTTDVASRPQFASRRTTKVLDGVSTIDWFASDFTLAEIKQLRAIQPALDRDQSFNGRYEIPTLAEVLDLVRRKSAEEGRKIGVYPETKHPTFHQTLGLPLEDRLLEELSRAGLNRPDAPVFIQSFEVSNLQYLRTRTRVKLVQLIDGDSVGPDGIVTLAPPFDKPYDFAVRNDPRTYKDMLTPRRPARDRHLRRRHRAVEAVHPRHEVHRRHQRLRGRQRRRRGRRARPRGDRALGVVADAHAAGLLVHPFTFRNEQYRLASDFKTNPVNEYLASSSSASTACSRTSPTPRAWRASPGC